VQALKIIQQVSSDGYLHIKIPPTFSAKRVELIILPLPELLVGPVSTNVKESEPEWDIDYDTVESAFGQTMHTFELLDYECGAEDPSKWK
jgi:hypothetical protein